MEIENQRLNKILNDYSLLSSTSASVSASNKEAKVSETDLFHYRETLQVYYIYIYIRENLNQKLQESLLIMNCKLIN